MRECDHQSHRCTRLLLPHNSSPKQLPCIARSCFTLTVLCMFSHMRTCPAAGGAVLARLLLRVDLGQERRVGRRLQRSLCTPRDSRSSSACSARITTDAASLRRCSRTATSMRRTQAAILSRGCAHRGVGPGQQLRRVVHGLAVVPVHPVVQEALQVRHVLWPDAVHLHPGTLMN